MQINEAIAIKVLETVDAGLCAGMGKPIPGQMCVEAAVCYAMGLPHSDEPSCVAPSLRMLKINLNDKKWSSNAVRAQGLRRLALAQLGSAGHLDEPEFGRLLGKLAITSCAAKALRSAAKVQKDKKHIDALNAAADRCAIEGTIESALAGRAAAYAAANANGAYAAAAAAANVADAANAAANAANVAAAAAANVADAYAAANVAAAAAAAADAANAADAAERDRVLAEFAEEVVQILIDLKAPGRQWLSLTEAP